MKDVIMYAHSGSENHGCEAIVRSTCKMLNDNYKTILLSSAVKADKKYHIDHICDKLISVKEYKKTTVEYLKYAFKYRFKSKYASPFPAACWKIKKDIKNSIALSIGGDNYCYVNANMDWLLEELIESHQYFRKKGAKTVLWGCSIEEETLKNKRLREDIKKFDLITVRETLSQSNLEKYGITDNVVLTCDSAFFLDKKETKLPKLFIEGNTVGINVSPMVLDNEKKSGIVMENYCKLIDYIIDNTNMNIVFIPHVIWQGNDDRIVLEVLYEKYRTTDRVMKIDDCNCEELKWIISKCRFFIGARTHATIAAYSSFVPTLVVGYSIKSKGIAMDLFGTYGNYVVSASSLDNDERLLNAFQWIMKNEQKIVRDLREAMPVYGERFQNALHKLITLSKHN